MGKGSIGQRSTILRQRNLRRVFLTVVLLGGALLLICVLLFTSRSLRVTLKHSEPLEDSSFLTDSFLENNPHGEYPDRFPCYYTRLRKAQTQSDDATNTSDTQPTRCRKHEPSPSACEEANTQYGNPDYLPPLRQCSYEGIPNICNVTRTNRAGFDLACDVTSCKGSQVYIARVNPNMGTVTAWKVIEPFDVIRVKDIAVKAQDEGFSFLYLQCRGFLQVLGLPPKLLIGSPVPYDRRLNINIVVVDSVARTHFFRAMKRSVSAMREIIYDDTIPATVLDFESFQAISMHTFDNIRPLFSGVTKVNNHFSRKASKTLHPLGINVLYGHYKKHGYQTIFQEDLCWQDSWGIMLNNLQQHGDGQDNGQIPLMDAKRWSDFQHVVKSHQIDHLGLTHFSCEVLMQYNRRNPYDGPGHVCLNGLYYSIYFLRYIALMTREIARDFHAAPLISYQHLNTGHTDWGTRVTNDDEPLAQFLNAMAHDPNTLTIVLSDHGHTRTPYASTDEGQNELYSPFLFMVLPNHVASLLGKQRVEALVKNQQRIFTTLDLHKALMSLHSTDKPSSDYKQAGIFAKIPADRTCSDLPLSPLARCRCEGWDEKAEKNSPRIKWLAEFAVGALNDLIQEQYVKGLNPSTWNRRSVPGNCVRLLGKSFSNIRQRRDAQKNLLTTFDLHVTAHTSVPLIEDEVFKVAISHGETWAVLQSYSRHTLYNKYKYCADRHVNLKLCICRKKRVRSPEYMKEVISSGMFGSETSVKDIYNGCVFLTSRSHDGLTVVYELANLCTQTKNVIIYGEPYYMQVSKQLPFSIRAEPNTVYFVISGVRRMLEFSYLDLATIVENDESIAEDVFTRPSLYQGGATT